MGFWDKWFKRKCNHNDNYAPPFIDIKNIKINFIAKSKTSSFLDISVLNLDAKTNDVLEKIKYNNHWNQFYENMNINSSKNGYSIILVYKSEFNNNTSIELMNINELPQIIDNTITDIKISEKIIYDIDLKLNIKKCIRLYLDENKNVRQETTFYYNIQNDEWELQENITENISLPVSEIPIVIYPNNSTLTADGFGLDGLFEHSEHSYKKMWDEIDWTGAKLNAWESRGMSAEEREEITNRMRGALIYTPQGNFRNSQNKQSNTIDTAPNQVDKHLQYAEYIDKKIDLYMGIESANAKKSAQETDKQVDQNNKHATNIKNMEALVKEEALSRLFKIMLEIEKNMNNNTMVKIPDIIKVKINKEDIQTSLVQENVLKNDKEVVNNG